MTATLTISEKSRLRGQDQPGPWILVSRALGFQPEVGAVMVAEATSIRSLIWDGVSGAPAPSMTARARMWVCGAAAPPAGIRDAAVEASCLVI